MISESFMSLAEQIDATLGDDKKTKSKAPKEKVKATGKKESVHFLLDTSQKDELQKLCKDNGLTLTRGLLVAFGVLKECIDKGLVEITPFGATFKKDLEK